MLRAIDRAAFAVALARRLRTRGVPASVTGTEDFVRALGLYPPETRSRLYWTARICLVRRHTDLAVFDAVFQAVFDHAALEVDPHARRTPLGSTGERRDSAAPAAGTPAPGRAAPGLPWATLPPAGADAEDSDSNCAAPERLPGRDPGLPDVPFERLDAQEMALLERWLQAAVRTWPTRRSRRRAVDARGHRVAVRPTIARSRRTGWELIHLERVRPVDKPRRVVMLCDVSQSMQAQTTAYLHLMRALALAADTEVFAFATTLTRLTTVLGQQSAEAAIEQATAKVADRFGGTRIATNLQALLASHHGDALRGAIVVIGSDGWDSDPPEELAAAMARLRRRAHRVVWMNPRAAAPGFTPRVASMAAALPFCDAFLPAHSFRSLADVVGEISRSRYPVSSTASRGSRAGTGRR
jgi:uncharacterized protein with von Willebrand factor type A (vWA) domain